MDHLKFAGKPEAEQRLALEELIRAEPVLMEVLHKLRALNLPDWMLVSGAIYNYVWNQLTGKPSLSGIKDIDIVYFDDRDLSYGAEDDVIKIVDGQLGHLPVPVETRNQARVHLWFPEKFNQPFSPLKSSEDMLTRYASKTHAVGVRLEADERMKIYAPFGLDDIFSFRIVPNYVLENQNAHSKKGARAKMHWPELTVIPW